jgi:hypothetical protein
MTGFMDILIQKRWFFIAGVFIIADVFLVSLLASTAQAHHINTSARSHSAANVSTAPPHTYDSPNAVTNAMLMLMDDTSQAANTVEQQALGGVASVSMSVAHGGMLVRHGAYVSTVFVVHGIGATFAFMGHAAVGSVVFAGRVAGSILTFDGHVISGGFGLMGHGLGGGFGAVGDVVGSSFSLVGHAVGGTVRFASDVTHVGSIIRPEDHTAIPTITQLRAQQAALIVSGTKDVTIASITSGVGGACDDGDGNGGYPMKWCGAAMDSIETIPYSGAAINRECTSYAYWYFTSVEGHAGFRAWGNAKYWAATSNYPTHTAPTVGAIAVETAGAYGHVAIVQALPGHKYAGGVVPAGYVLVSEMNYDWNGHFRYSYSPLSKFSAYIYP